ncbi:phosphoglycerate dehydrogenase [Aquirufa echingensis]|uniref:Phosphoglycerate dehydrogenase n=1 Tax=Aquirufa echingensis TaxID=3096516 RepID=A0ABW6CX35_9BACT
MKVKVSTVAFSTNQLLVKELKRHFQDVEINEKGVRIPESELASFYKDADAIIVGLEKITPELLDRLPNLKIIAKYGVGLDNINLEACYARNVSVGWTGGVNKRSVAEMTLGFMLALCRNLYSTSNQLKSGIWNKNGGSHLTGKTIGIIGVGNIGKELISLLSGFQCNFLLNDIVENKELDGSNLTFVDKETLFKESDFITLHTPLTTETNNLIDLEALKKMKRTAFLINTARGGIINELDLKIALEQGIIAGAALDVYETEPPQDLELLRLENLITTPHTGGNALEAVLAMGNSAIEHLLKFKNSYN